MRALEQMLSATPNRVVLDRRLLEDCIEACVECELACTGCIDACLGAKDVDPLRKCIRLNQDCAGACSLTAHVLVRQFDGDREFVDVQLEACIRGCAACGAECQSHASRHEHCRICAETCRRCEAQCRILLRALRSIV